MLIEKLLTGHERGVKEGECKGGLGRSVDVFLRFLCVS